MFYMLKAYWEATKSIDLTDIFSGGESWDVLGKPADTAFWEYWLEAYNNSKSIEQMKYDGEKQCLEVFSPVN